MVTVRTDDIYTQELCLAYCDAKSALWNMFFGWRSTHNNTMVFKMPAKAWRRICKRDWSE